MAHNPPQNDRTKHIEVDRYFIMEKVNSDLICTTDVPSQQLVVDILSKGSSNPTFQTILLKLGIAKTY